MWENADRRHQIVETLNTMAFDGDAPENLGATAMVTNAYLYTGDDKYRRWVLDYVDAWLERSRDNGGIIPDNIGPSGVIGEHRNGQWWGGLKGWSREHGAQGLLISVAIGAECAHLLTGDSGYLELMRAQTDALLERSKTGEDGDLLVPMRYGFTPRDPAGDASPEWRDFAKLGIYELSHLYHASMSERDRGTIARLRDGDPQRQWNDVSSQRDRRSGDAEYARFQYYDGLNPNWPLDIQDAELRFVTVMLQAMRQDPRDTREDHPGQPLAACTSRVPGATRLRLRGGQPTGAQGPDPGDYRGTAEHVQRWPAARQRPLLRCRRQQTGSAPRRRRAGRPVEARHDGPAVGEHQHDGQPPLDRPGRGIGEHQFTDARVLTRRGTASILNPLGWLAESKTTVESVVPVNGKYFAVELPPPRP